MSPLVKGLLASALTLPLVAFVAGVLASPEPVDPDRSRPVIIGNVNDDKPADDRTQSPPRDQRTPRDAAPDPRGDDSDDGPHDGPGDDVTDDQPYTVVTPPPRDVDEDDGGGDDDDDADDSDDRERSRDD